VEDEETRGRLEEGGVLETVTTTRAVVMLKVAHNLDLFTILVGTGSIQAPCDSPASKDL